MSDVKRSTRGQKSQQTRLRIVEAASELFVQRGYGVTNLQDVAAAAGVAVQTIYFVFGNKRKLLKELVDITIAGDDEPLATMDRPWFRETLAADTADAQLRAHVRGTRAVLERVAPIVRMVEAASATDADVAAMWPHGVDPRFVVQSAAAEAMMSKPGARTDVSVERAADLLYGLLGPELFLLFVRERGWSTASWEEWTYATLLTQLCDVEPSSSR